jgi:hypothetical protein
MHNNNESTDTLNQVLNTVRDELAVKFDIDGDVDPADWVIYDPGYLLAKAKAALLMLEAELTLGGNGAAAVRNQGLEGMKAITMLIHQKGKL